MPLIGLIDEDGRCIEWADIIKGKGNFEDPVPVLTTLYSDRVPYCDFSITELMDDPYHLQMKRRFDFFEHTDRTHDAMLGTAVHASLERARAPEGYAREVRVQREVAVEMKVSGAVRNIGGTADVVCPPELWDYKTTTMAQLQMFMRGQLKDKQESHTRQGNGYRWLLAQHGVTGIKRMYIRFIVRDWRAYEARKKKNPQVDYPRGARWKIPLLKLEDTETWLKYRLKLHVRAERLSDKDLYKAGECDTWNNYIRCNEYCTLSTVCHFHRRRK
jgi:hypothetical protein